MLTRPPKRYLVLEAVEQLVASISLDLILDSNAFTQFLQALTAPLHVNKAQSPSMVWNMRPPTHAKIGSVHLANRCRWTYLWWVFRVFLAALRATGLLKALTQSARHIGALLLRVNAKAVSITFSLLVIDSYINLQKWDNILVTFPISNLVLTGCQCALQHLWRSGVPSSRLLISAKIEALLVPGVVSSNSLSLFCNNSKLSSILGRRQVVSLISQLRHLTFMLNILAAALEPGVAWMCV